LKEARERFEEKEKHANEKMTLFEQKRLEGIQETKRLAEIKT
jgi:hypothetical protein